MFPSSSDVELSQCGGNLRPVPSGDHHDVSVPCESVDVHRELRVAHFHSLELRLRLGAAELELLDDVGHSFEAVSVVVLGTVT